MEPGRAGSEALLACPRILSKRSERSSYTRLSAPSKIKSCDRLCQLLEESLLDLFNFHSVSKNNLFLQPARIAIGR